MKNESRALPCSHSSLASTTISESYSRKARNSATQPVPTATVPKKLRVSQAVNTVGSVASR